ncbi:MAG: hypothetical protein NTZ78_09600 [Candidatus Aureabacteria bacterium]|nr:hypothetical protein [Candidatus Auribacterota bacterium]
MKRVTVAAVSVMFAVGLCGMVIAGSLDSPGAPSVGSGMHTLLQIYNYLNSGVEATPVPGFQEPGAGPGPTMKTTTDIYNAIKASYAQCPATTADVKSGVKFFCTQLGSWGVRTGTAPAQTWYQIYGPDGEDLVARIGDLYVAKYTDNAGTDFNGTKNWADACSWGTSLNWLEATDWRMPGYGEIDGICSASGCQDWIWVYDGLDYWSCDGGEDAWVSHWASCSGNPDSKETLYHVRAVRSAL